MTISARAGIHSVFGELEECSSRFYMYIVAVTLKLRAPNRVRTNVRRPERTRKRALVVKNIDTARIVCGRFYVTVRCPSVCLYGPAIDNCSSVRRVCCCGPGGQEVSIDCCTAGARQQRRRSSTAVSSKCEQCHVSSRRRTLNTFSRMGATSKKCVYFISFDAGSRSPSDFGPSLRPVRQCTQRKRRLW